MDEAFVLTARRTVWLCAWDGLVMGFKPVYESKISLISLFEMFAKFNMNICYCSNEKHARSILWKV